MSKFNNQIININPAIIQYCMKFYKYTKSKFAEKTKINNSHLDKIIRGDEKLTIKELKNICKITKQDETIFLLPKKSFIKYIKFKK